MVQDSKKRINIILADNSLGSIARLTVAYANGFVDNGFDVTISYPAGSWYRYFLFQKNISMLSFFFFRFSANALVNYILKKQWSGKKVHKLSENVRLNLYLIKPTKDSMPNADYILIFQNYLLFDILDFPSQKGQIVDSLHTGNYENDSQIGPFWRYVTESAIKRTNVKRFATSQATKNYLQKRGITVNKVIHQGIDLSEFKSNDFDEKAGDAMMFCNNKEAKGYTFGVNVIRELKKSGNRLKWHAIGGNIEGLDTSIFDHVYGYLENTEYALAYRRHRLFLYPSLFDGFPAPPLEAMASGAVCILARVGGVEEYAVDKENCILCEPGDLEAFVQKAKMAVADVALQRKISRNAIETARRFGIDHMVREIVNFIRD